MRFPSTKNKKNLQTTVFLWFKITNEATEVNIYFKKLTKLQYDKKIASNMLHILLPSIECCLGLLGHLSSLHIYTYLNKKQKQKNTSQSYDRCTLSNIYQVFLN